MSSLNPTGTLRDIAAEFARLDDDLETIRAERDRYRRMVDCLYDKMVKISHEHEDKFNCVISDNHVTIMNPNGEFVYSGRLNRLEIDKIWKAMWGLDRI